MFYTLSPPPDSPEELNKRGLLKVTAETLDQYTNFVLMNVGNDQVALLSWQGFLSAQIGQGTVYANRPWVRDWEKWTLIPNSDGTVTLKSSDGRCLGTSSYPDHSCFCDQTETSKPEWTQFKLVSLDNGQVALYNGCYSKYVNVVAS